MLYEIFVIHYVLFVSDVCSLFYRFPVPSYTLHSEGKARDHMDRAQEVWL